MINRENFYNKNDDPTFLTKKKMWRKIRKSVRVNDDRRGFFIETRSFALGIVSAVVLFFMLTGIYSIGKSIYYDQQPAVLTVNRAYFDAINNIEDKLPEITPGSFESKRVDELMMVKKEELKTLNGAIDEFYSEKGRSDISPVKLKKLRKLYRLKLEVINTIIEMQETGYENY